MAVSIKCASMADISFCQPGHMLSVPAKSSETRAILLLISSDIEHLWNRNRLSKRGVRRQ
jgi:hypothetical protein